MQSLTPCLPARWTAALAATLFVGLCGTPAIGQTSYESNINALGGYLPSGSDDFVYDGGDVSLKSATPLGLVRQIASPNPFVIPDNGYAEGWSNVETAGLHVYARSLSTASPDIGDRTYSSVAASGFFNDFFVLNVPGYALGTVFDLTTRVVSDGHVSARSTPSSDGIFHANLASAYAYWESWIRLAKGDQMLGELRAREDCAEFSNLGSGAACSHDGALGLGTMTFSVANGSLLHLDMRGWAAAGSSASNLVGGTVEGDGIGDLANTIAWGGISLLRDPDGVAIEDFSAVSATSGFDYRNPYGHAIAAVPEPEIAPMLLAGLLTMGVLARRRRRQAESC
jgi:hypothetical protein